MNGKCLVRMVLSFGSPFRLMHNNCVYVIVLNTGTSKNINIIGIGSWQNATFVILLLNNVFCLFLSSYLQGRGKMAAYIANGDEYESAEKIKHG